MKVIFALVLLFVAFINAQISYPNLPLVFTSDVDISIEQSSFPFPQSFSGRLYYDYNAQAQRQDSEIPMSGVTVSKLDRFDQMHAFSWAQGEAQCQCEDLIGTLPLYSVLPGSAYNGQSNINGITCDAWNFNLVSGVNLTLFVDPNREVLVQAIMVVEQQGNTITTTMAFFNVDTGAIDSSVFDPPSICGCPAPAPPATPAPNACPNNPPAGCECLQSTLSFCSEVNYPITSNLGITDTDAMVGDMFNNFVKLTAPTQECQNNMKSFLCATLIPMCVSEPIPVLPCASLCPTCSCSGTQTPGNNTCAAALPSASVCTQYGSPYC